MGRTRPKRRPSVFGPDAEVTQPQVTVPAMPDDGEKQVVRRTLRVFAVPWLMVIAVVLGWLLGNYLDRKLGLSVPVATIVLVIVAVVAGGYQSYRIIMRVLRD